jgi:O-6-methylguanine DNA methyltransferase
MMAERDDELRDALGGSVLDAVREEPDPGFALALRAELRGRQARATQNLWWFDVDLPVGTIRLVHDEELVHLVDNDPYRLELRTQVDLGFEPRHGDSKRVRAAAEQVLSGRKRGSELAFLGELTPFQQTVLRTTSRIPRGGIRPYSWVAREAGNPGAVRAAGTTLSHNPVPFIVPCHRVVHADWSLGKYSAGGPEKKREVLAMEGMTDSRLEWIQHAPRFVGTIDAQAFCLPACEGLDETDPSNLRAFASPQEAVAAGYEPCETCRPISIDWD